MAENPRVLVATGSATGGRLTIAGTRYEFSNMDAAGNGMEASGPIDFVGQFDLQCTSTYCRLPAGSGLYEVRAVGGALVIVDSGMLTPYGSTMACGHPPLPGNGVVTVESQTTVQGVQVPAVIRFTGGTSSGTGNNSSISGYQLAWDLVGTRQP